MVYLVEETLFPEIVPNELGWVYFGLGLGGINLIKIGHTMRTPDHRGGEVHFNPLCCVPGSKRTERMFHRKYAAERIGKSEWFHLSDRLALDLIVMCTQQGLVKSVEILKFILAERLNQSAA